MADEPPPFVIRPIREADLEPLCRLMDSLTDSLTTIPREPAFLKRRIGLSERSFHPGIEEPGPEQYVFVLEDPATGHLVGTSAVIARVGGYTPFYTYGIVEEEYAHPPLGIRKSVPVLHLHANHDGPTEIGSLYLHPEHRRGGLGRLASLSRFLFMARFPERFRPACIAELRGWLDENNRSPFWDTVGHYFFEREFHEADFLSGLGNKDFIKDLMPRHPIYLPMLPYSVQKVVGKVHRHTGPARRLLEQEGFRWTNEIDIFDAGPLLSSPTSRIRTAQACRTSVVDRIAEVPEDEPVRLLANNRLDFRACLGRLRVDGNTAILPPETARLLQVEPGERVQSAPLR